MFQVTRYDPKRNEQKTQTEKKETENKNKKRRRWHNEGKTAIRDEPSQRASTLRVVAEETTGPISRSIEGKLNQPTTAEAFDDLDLVEDLLGEDSVKTEKIEERHDVSQPSKEEIKLAVRMSELPLEEAAAHWKLAPFLVENLKRDGFEHFFPIQALAIPDVIMTERNSHFQAQDICITAPTGSGKTLSYVLPVLNALANRQIRRLRALIVLPSRDLAIQVHTVFQSYMAGSDLSVGLSIGRTEFVAEQVALTLDTTSANRDILRHRLSVEPDDLELAMAAYADGQPHPTSHVPRDGWSNVDVLVCTPGRLVDHLDCTPGFTLQHLRFLIVDEADRLLSQRYNNWIDCVIEATKEASLTALRAMEENKGGFPQPKVAADGLSLELDPITWRQGGLMSETTSMDTYDTLTSAVTAVCKHVQLRKMLISATLTRDPQKLSSLRLVNPKHFDVHQIMSDGKQGSTKYFMPDALEEYAIECKAEQKPMVLLAILLEKLQQNGAEDSSKQIIIVFTSSIDSTHRLARLLQLMWISAGFGTANAVGEFSSALNQHQRAELVKRCADPKDNLSVIVCSDGMSRGMDVEHVSTVVNYDVPRLAKTYVHRCGRTARANKKGAAITVLKGGQGTQFNKLRALIHQSDRVKSMKIKKHLVRDAIPRYKTCIRVLRDVIEAEENGELHQTDIYLDEYLFEYEEGNDEPQEDGEAGEVQDDANMQLT